MVGYSWLRRPSACQRSYQHGRGRGVLVVPSGFVVMYVFSEGKGSLGLGAMR
jgi:hypothetical protein